MIPQEKIERFFSNKCSPQEAAEVKAWLESNPDALYDLENEWNTFQLTENLSPKVSLNLWQQIEKETRPTPVISLFFKRFAIAASILLILSVAGYLIFYKTRHNGSDIAEIKNGLKTITNTSGAKMKVAFSDSSIAELMPNSSVTFSEQFEATKREVSLKGEAYFVVAKDSTRPFSVFSDSIITTVLGTKFIVKSYAEDSNIHVLLKEGKVQITSVNGVAFKNASSFYYLYPGDTFVYNKLTSEAFVQSAKINDNSINPLVKRDTNAKTVAMADTTVKNKRAPISFHDQPLRKVLPLLEKYYNTRIKYDRAEIRDIHYSNTIDGSESLESILSAIAVTNDLTLSKKGKMWLLLK